MRKLSFLTALCFLVGVAANNVFAQRTTHRQHVGRQSASTQANCFDASDPTEIRLWEGRAPGAIGDDPCRDIPYLKRYTPESHSSATRTAIIIMPGGGYDRLTDKKEQAPVGEYFSQQLHVTAFVLYYRLVQPDGTYRYPIPMWDGQRALRLIRYRAAQFSISSNRIGLFGFSAGGHLASTLAALGNGLWPPPARRNGYNERASGFPGFGLSRDFNVAGSVRITELSWASTRCISRRRTRTPRALPLRTGQRYCAYSPCLSI
jgi:acetyl esterase/lipase